VFLSVVVFFCEDKQHRFQDNKKAVRSCVLLVSAWSVLSVFEFVLTAVTLMDASLC